MTPDGVAALVRALALAALFQAAGGTVFTGCFGEQLGAAASPVRRLVLVAAIAAMLLIATHGGVETARLGGEFADAWDPDLQRLFWTSRGGLVHVGQLGAMALIAVCVRGRTRAERVLAMLGAIAATAAFAESGHTSTDPSRAALAPLLIIHVTVGACWFGSLATLLLMTRRETTSRTISVLNRFSRIAGYSVPFLGVAGVAIAFVLIPRLESLAQPYGLMLTGKVILFSLLLMLASYNRWKHVPAMIAGSSTAANALRRTIGCEIALICAVFAATAIMTTFFSPNP